MSTVLFLLDHIVKICFKIPSINLGWALRTLSVLRKGRKTKECMCCESKMQTVEVGVYKGPERQKGTEEKTGTEGPTKTNYGLKCHKETQYFVG